MSWTKASVAWVDLDTPENHNQMKNRQIYISFFVVSLLLALLSPTNLSSQVLPQKKWQIDEMQQRKFDYYYYEAINAKSRDKYAEAFDYFQYCHELDSTNASVLTELGAFYSFLGNNTQAYHFFKKAVGYAPDNYDYNFIYANICKALNMDEEVVSIYENMIEKFPNKTDLYYELAEAYSNSGELKKAIKTLTKLESIVGVSDVITMNKFRLYNMLGQRDKIFEEMQEIIDKNPTDLRYPMVMGDLYLHNEQYDNALKYYNRVKEMDADYPALIPAMVNYYEKTGNNSAAEAEITKATTNPKMDIGMKLQLITRYIDILLENEKDTKIVTPLFQSLFEQYPNYSDLNLLYGNVLLLQNNKEGAYNQFDVYALTNPTNPVGYEQMLRIALPDSVTQVVDITDRAMKNIPEAPQFYFYAGLAKYLQNNYPESLRIFQEGLEKATFDNPLFEADFYGQIGDLHYAIGNKQLAFQNYDKSLALNPQNLHILNNYSYYLSVDNKQLDKAEQMSGITIKAEPTNPTYLDTYGWILFMQRSYVMAKIYLQKAVQYSQDEPSADVLEHYGDVLAVTGETEEALVQWQKAKELGSDSKTLDKKIEQKQYMEE